MRPPDSSRTSRSLRRSGAGPYRGGAGVLPSRAWPRADRAREIAATIAKQSRPHTQTVAGYDLTFSPVKSVSTLWAVADPHVAAQIERAHRAAVRDALTFIERHALFTRQGRNGVRQVKCRAGRGRVHPPRLPSR